LFAFAVLYTHAHLLGGFGEDSFQSWTGGSLILGTVGIQAFFVFNGSLIATSWIRRASLGRFLWCRLLRLGPTLWGCIVVTALVFGPIICHTTRGNHGDFFR
jgi:peptidoglycan/LPS O-acetylase OafA/YrhL